MDQTLTIPRWSNDLDVSQLDLPELFAQAMLLGKSLGKALEKAGWPIVKLLPRDWSKPIEHLGKQYSYLVKSAVALDDEEGSEPEQGSDLLWLTASTDAVDIEGDVIALPALKKIKAASVGQTLFLGHRYRVPKDVAGLVEKSRLVRKEIFHPLLNKSLTFNCVMLGVRPIPKAHNKGGWRACQMALKGTARVGASVTVLSTSQDESKKPIIIHNDCISLETSLVGLPANMTAWAHATKKKAMVSVQSSAHQFAHYFA